MYITVKCDDRYASESRELYGGECIVSSIWNDGILITGNVVELRMELESDEEESDEDMSE